MGGGGGPGKEKVDKTRDIVAEDTVFGTAERGREFLGQGIEQFDFASQIRAALSGVVPPSVVPLVNTLRQESLQNQSTALRDIDARTAGITGNRTQTGVQSLIGQLISDFSRDRSQIPARVIGDILRNLIPAQTNQNTQTAARSTTALQASGNFNPVSQGRQAQSINLARAGQPPEQKSGGAGAGIGSAIGTAVGVLLAPATGGASLAIPLAAGAAGGAAGGAIEG